MKVGLIIPMQGAGGLWALPASLGAKLAADRINAGGGVLDAPLQLDVADCGTDGVQAARAARRLVEEGGADVIVGMHPSDLRGAVREAVGLAAPYVYVSQFEGGYCGPRVLATGATDPELIGPAMAWLAEARRVRRVFFVGNDYVWPRVALSTTDAAVRAVGGRVVGALTVGIGEESFAPALAAIGVARPDLVVTVLLGEEAARFHRAFAETGLGPRMLRFGLGVDETVLLAIGAEGAENLYTAADFLGGADDAATAAFEDAYARAWGRTAPPPSCITRACHDGVRVAAALAVTQGVADGPSLAARLPTRIGRRVAPRLIGRTAGLVRRPARIGEADGLGFRVVGGV